MKSCLVVIRSRAELFNFKEKMHYSGRRAEIVPLPKEAKSGCGLCVKIECKDAFFAIKVATRYYSSFYGVYSYDERTKKFVRV